ncbi:MAG: hypothetical protein CVU46_03005 [Chloroflexi bacterium HGW-Chloroflexi-8]|nr:MAG: hypothetical protein CVU46_03005 [Chloroflexi bacterium HGW-Chloroflexi-8]
MHLFSLPLFPIYFPDQQSGLSIVLYNKLTLFLQQVAICKKNDIYMKPGLIFVSIIPPNLSIFA